MRKIRPQAGVIVSALWASSLAAIALQAPSALAQEQPAPAAPADAAPAADAAAAPTSNAMTTPAMSAAVAANANPYSVDLGDTIGKVFVTGALTGLGLWQNNYAPGDHGGRVDLSNGQIILQKTDGLVQFFVQAGGYSIPDLGTPYVQMSKLDRELYTFFPQAFLKIAPSDSFSIQIGKLPTVIGAEYTFSYENLNIERGLLWNQEPAVSRGIQANYTSGPLTLSLSVNDGLYSGHYNWLSGIATYVFDPSNTLAFAAGGNLGHTGVSTFATPLAQNNEAIINLLYTYTSGPWTLNPYFQYTSVPSNKSYGFYQSADTYGFALLLNYAFDSGSMLAGFSLPARIEYIGSSGSLRGGAPSLLYGPGSDAFSITVTPTYQHDIFVARAEISYVTASSTTPGYAFGQSGIANSQTRFLLEAGIVF